MPNCKIVEICLISEYRDYYIHYQKSVLEQMPNPLCLLPSILSHNAKVDHPMPTNIIERLDWLNSQPQEKSSTAALESIHTLSRFASNEKAETPQAEAPRIEVLRLKSANVLSIVF